MTKRNAKPKKPAPKEQRKPGRPTAYKAVYAKQAAKLCELGATDKELADFFNVSERTLNEWKHKHPAFLQSIKTAKDAADERVIRSLYNRAVGYSFDSEKVFNGAEGIVRTGIVEHVPPDVTAAIYWLNNRRSAEWRTRKAVEAAGPGGGPIPHTHSVRIDPAEVAASIQKLKEALI